MDILTTIKEKAAQVNKKILLPESTDLRILQAAQEISVKRIATVTLIGDEQEIYKKAAAHDLDLDNIEIILPAKDPRNQQYTEELFALRKDKGLTLEQAAELINNPLYFGAMMVYRGDMDGMVAGSLSTTGDVLRPALQIIKTKKPFKTVSGAFLMSVPNCQLGHNGLFIFADCAVNIDPDAQTLAEIGLQAAHTAKALGNFDPVIGFLSFSTKGSAKHEWVNKVVEAVEIAKKLDPTLEIDGEFQADAALIESVGRQKAPASKVAGRVNVLIFPDLQSGNISYKLVQRLGNAIATGPVLQGLAKPVNDLSRGCNVEDIVNMVAITAVQANSN